MATPAGADRLYVTHAVLRAPADTPGNVARFGVSAAGQLDPRGTVEAGRGARGMVSTVLNGRRFAYVASQLAAAPGETRLGRIDRYEVAADGALTFRGSTSTDQPFGIALHPDGRTIYVANNVDEDGPEGPGSLSAFRVGRNGDLTLLNTVDSGTNHPKFPTVAPNGRYLFVSNETLNAATPAHLTGYAIADNGALREEPVARATIGESGHRVVITRDGRFVYVTARELGEPQGDPDVYGFRIGHGGRLTPIPGTPVEAGVLVEGAALSPDDTRLYVAAIGRVQPPTEPPVLDGRIRWFSIGNDGRLGELGSIAFGLDPVDMAFGSAGTRLYVADFSGRVADQGRGTVSSFGVDAGGGLTHLHTVLSQGLDPAAHSVTVLPG